MHLRIWIALWIPAVIAGQTQSAGSVFAADCAGKPFMGAVLIRLKGKTVFEGACGFANAEWGVRNTVDTKFRAASVAKNFTAAAVLLLQREGKLSVQDPIGTFIRDLPVEWRTATIHQLLTHTSGIPTFTGEPNRRLDRMGATPRELLAVVRERPLQFPHGTRLAYNNTGYILLGMLIESVSGIAYADFVQQRLFTPLGMKATGFDEARKVLPRRATGYRLVGDALENAESVDATVAWSAGGFYSTVGDLVLWGESLLSGKFASDGMFRIFPETLLQGMHYGYGIVIAERFGRRLYYHGGGITGFSSVLQVYPDDGLVIAVLSNLDAGATHLPSWTVADHLAARWLRDASLQ